MTRDELTRPWSDDDLRKLPSESGQQFEGPNPFTSVTDHPFGLQNAKRWSFFHNDRGRKMEPAADLSDPLAALAADLSISDAGWYRHDGPHGPAYFPQTATDVAAWEESAKAMTERQVTITVPAKPSEPMRTRPTREQDPNHKPEPIKFEDSAESRKLRKLERGD